MKKLLLIVAVLFFSIGDIVAQDVDFDRVRLGIFIMPAPSIVGAENTDIETGSGFGFGGGIIADYAFSERYWLGTGIGITNLPASTIVTNASSFTTTADYNIRYLEIPITIKLLTGEIGTGSVGYFKYFGQAGVNLAVPLSARFDLTSTDPSMLIVEENEKANKQIQKVNLGLIIAAGAEYNVADQTSLYAALWYNSGFTGILKSVQGLNDNDDRVTLGYIGLKFGAMF